MEKLMIRALGWHPASAARPVLDQVTLCLEKGHFYGVLGQNGSGKTSLARHILRLLPVREGGIAFDTTPLGQLSQTQLAKTVAYMPQASQIQADFTVYDVVAMGRTPYLRPFEPLGAADRRAVEAALALTGCEAFAQQSILTVSGGERQRAIMARTIAQQTPWMVIDEPVASLDVLHQTRLMHSLGVQHREKGTTIVAVMHDINLAAQHCTDLILMKAERSGVWSVWQVLTPENLRQVYDMPFVRAQIPGRTAPWFLPMIHCAGKSSGRLEKGADNPWNRFVSIKRYRYSGRMTSLSPAAALQALRRRCPASGAGKACSCWKKA
jgi:iron complex transport system ATP-binding protein